MVALGYGWYSNNARQDLIIEQQMIAIEQQKADNAQTYETMAILQDYNQKQINELAESRKQTWKEGVHDEEF